MTWEKVRLADICEVYGGTTPSTIKDDYWNGDVVWLSPTDLPDIGEIVHVNNSIKKITSQAVKESSLTIVPPGTVVYSTRASIGKIGIAEVPLTTNQGFANFVCNGKIFNKYLAYALKFYTRNISKLSNSTTFAEVSRTAIRNFYIPLPSYPTQQKIATILENADNLRRKDQQLLASYDTLLQSIFYQMFGDPVKNEKGWDKVELNKACSQITDGTHFSPPAKSSGIPYITAKHLKKDGLDFFSAPTYIDEMDHKIIFSRCRPVKGDVLYIKDGATTGIAAINEYEFEFSMLSSLALIKTNSSVLNNYYLVSWLNNPVIKDRYLQKFMAGAAIRRFTLSKINKFEILLPPIELQEQFAEIVKSILRQERYSRLQLEKSECLFQALFHKAFKGELKK
jgi:type I restriction enzyme, S subunit